MPALAEEGGGFLDLGKVGRVLCTGWLHDGSVGCIQANG